MLILIPKGAPAPMSLIAVDNELSHMMGEKPHEIRWCYDWYFYLSVGLDEGKSISEIKTDALNKDNLELVRILDYLENHFNILP